MMVSIAFTAQFAASFSLDIVNCRNFGNAITASFPYWLIASIARQQTNESGSERTAQRSGTAVMASAPIETKAIQAADRICDSGSWSNCPIAELAERAETPA